MKKLMFLLAFTLGLFATAEAQKVTKEVKSDTIEVVKVYVVDSATSFLKVVQIPFIVRKVEVNTVTMDGVEVPSWGKLLGFYDPKNKALRPVLIETKDGRTTVL